MFTTSKIALACVLVLGTAGLSAAQDTQPNVRMARDLVAAASAFETYTRTASVIDAGFAGPGAVARAVQVAAAHDPHQLERGLIAYAAMTALQDPAFVDGVERILAHPGGREDLVRRLTDNPQAAIGLPGAEGAAARARSALLQQVEPLLANGARVKQAAYDIQHQAWSRATVGDPLERLAMVKQLASQSFAPSQTDEARLYQAVSAQVAARPAAAPSPVVLHGLALAALALAGQTGEENAEALRPIVTDARSATCMHWAKLNLFQCMAVAGPHYEDVFCISQHAMLEAGQCLAAAAGADGPPAEMQTAQAGAMRVPIASRTPGER